MRQVPHYLLVGHGRVAQHFKHYFSLSSLSYDSWYRQQPLEKLYQHLETATHVLLLISDHAINDFVTQYIHPLQKICIHFSGGLTSPHAYGAHPLMTFNTKSYPLHVYQAIPFIVDHDAPDFEILLPGLTNPHVRIPTSMKMKYHALCVLSGNFSCMLWQKFMENISKEFHFPPEIVFPYLFQQLQNLCDDPSSALTGPLVREDFHTIEQHLLALQSDPFCEVYASFVNCYQQIKNNRGGAL